MEDKWWYKYKVVFWFGNEKRKAKGYVYAKDMVEVTKFLQEEYLDEEFDEFDKISIEPIDNGEYENHITISNERVV